MPNLFDPLKLGPLTLPNRIAVSPMCQYSAEDGSATDWHLQHLMQFAIARAGMVVVEATAVERVGRITHKCLGLYSDANEAALARVLKAAKARRRAGHLLCHPARPCRAQGLRPASRSRAPSRSAPASTPGSRWRPRRFPSAPRWHTPQALDAAGLERTIAGFRTGGGAIRPRRLRCHRAARRARLPAAPVPLAARQPTHRRLRRQRSRTACAFRCRWPPPCAPWCRARSRWARASAAATGPTAGSVSTRRWPSPRALKSHGYDYVCVSSGNVVPSKDPVCAGLPGTAGRQGERAGSGSSRAPSA